MERVIEVPLTEGKLELGIKLYILRSMNVCSTMKARYGLNKREVTWWRLSIW